MSSLLEFLTELSTNSESLENFSRDPEGTIDAAGLSSSEKEALLSGESDRVWNLLPSEMVAGRFPPPNVTITITLIVIKFGNTAE